MILKIQKKTYFPTPPMANSHQPNPLQRSCPLLSRSHIIKPAISRESLSIHEKPSTRALAAPIYPSHKAPHHYTHHPLNKRRRRKSHTHTHSPHSMPSAFIHPRPDLSANVITPANKQRINARGALA